MAKRHTAITTTPRETVAYRGYLIRLNALNGLQWIERGGVFCGWITSTVEAMATIDMLTEGGR